MSSPSLPAILDRVCGGASLDRDTSRSVFEQVMAGAVDPAMLAALLTALKTKGETADEIAGAAEAMRAAAIAFEAGGRCADSCGTGGDGAHTVNISTATALVAAAGGVRVVKHGNRSISSKCGSADVLEACGVTIERAADAARGDLDALGVCFLFAPQYHPGVRHAMPVRRALKVRTLFNLLGPLANPARPAVQLMGVYDPGRCVLMAETLGRLGLERALVVHGAGLDEIAVHGPTHAALLEGGEVRELTITPEDVGLSRHPIEALRGGEPEENGRWLQALAAGDAEPAHVAAVAINVGALLWLFGLADDHRTGVERAQSLIREGAAATVLSGWAARCAEGAG